MENDSPRRSGRGARLNVPNRFERLDVDIDPPGDGSAPQGSVGARYFEDASQSVLSKNESPEVPCSYSINPYKGCEYGCVYCYARPAHEHMGLSPGLDFETRIFVKTDAPRLLSKALQKKDWDPQAVSLSPKTDPYQPAEREFKITRKCLEVFHLHRNPVSIVTKSGLIRRDLDLLATLRERDLVSVTLSLTTLKDTLASSLEPQAERPSLRLETIEALANREIPVGILVAPVIPGLNDDELPHLFDAAADHGASFAEFAPLRLPHPVESLFETWLEEHVPERKPAILDRLRAVNDDPSNEDSDGSKAASSPLTEIFEQARKEAGLADGPPSLSTSGFRHLRGGQIDLFDPE